MVSERGAPASKMMRLSRGASCCRCRCRRAAAASSPSPQVHTTHGVVALPDAEHDLARLQELPATEIGPAVRRALHPMLDRTTESNMRLPDLTAAKAGSASARASWAGRSSNPR